MRDHSEQLDADFVDHSSPELKLWAAVLHLALQDAEPWIKNLKRTYEQEMYGQRALNWILSESFHHGGFRWVCFNLGLCHLRIRKIAGLSDKKNIW